MHKGLEADSCFQLGEGAAIHVNLDHEFWDTVEEIHRYEFEVMPNTTTLIEITAKLKLHIPVFKKYEQFGLGGPPNHGSASFTQS